jgi:hypothetical protein
VKGISKLDTELLKQSITRCLNNKGVSVGFVGVLPRPSEQDYVLTITIKPSKSEGSFVTIVTIVSLEDIQTQNFLEQLMSTCLTELASSLLQRKRNEGGPNLDAPNNPG